MITDVIIVINSNEQKDKITNSIYNDLFYSFIDERIDKTKAYKFKYMFGTKMTPFAVAYDKDKPVRGFYGESKEDVIESLIKYLNNAV